MTVKRDRRGGSSSFAAGGGDASPRNSGDAKDAYRKDSPQGSEGEIRYVERSSVKAMKIAGGKQTASLGFAKEKVSWLIMGLYI
jgi:hypothetical protein